MVAKGTGKKTVFRDEPDTALHGPARAGDLLGVQRAVLEEAGRVHARDFHGRTALHLAAFEGHAAVVKELCRAGAPVGAGAKDQTGALHFAAMKGHCEAARALLNAGAPLNAKTRKGLTALMIASKGGHLDLVRLLLKRKADPLLANPRDQTAAELCPAGAAEVKAAVEAAQAAARQHREEVRAKKAAGGGGQHARKRKNGAGDDEDGEDEEEGGGGGAGAAASIGPQLPPGRPPKRPTLGHLAEDSDDGSFSDGSDSSDS